jgi:dihydroxy-acid dehydratase
VNSDQIKSGPSRAPARAMLRATGLSDADIAKPLVGVVHTWSDISPCNLTLKELAQSARRSSSTPSP